MADDPSPNLRQQVTGSAAGAVVGMVVGGPPGAILGAMAQAAFVHLLDRLETRYAARRDLQMAQMFQVAGQTIGIEAEDLEARITARPALLHLAGEAANGAAGARYDERIIALGRALAAGVIAEDDSTIDQEFLVVAALSALDSPRVSFLDFAAQFPNAASLYMNMQVLQTSRPWLVPVYYNLLATLTRHNLIFKAVLGAGDVSADSDQECLITAFGRAVLDRLYDAGLTVRHE